MTPILYTPSRDEILLELHPHASKPTKKVGPFKLWWDKEGYINAIAIGQYRDQLIEFRKKLRTVQLGGIWKGEKITEEDIRETREDLLKRLEGKW